MKLVKVSTTKHRVTYINPDHITVIDQSPVDPNEVCMVVGLASIWITATEFARILPLLTDTSAPAAASDVNSDHLALLDEYGGWLRGWLGSMNTMEGQARAAQLRDEILDTMKAPSLPRDVVAAYHAYAVAEHERESHHENDTGGVLYFAMNAKRHALIDLLGQYIPTEESESDD